MKNVYKVTFDVKLQGEWLGGPRGWSSRNVLSNGDVRDACLLLEQCELQKQYEVDDVRTGKTKKVRPSGVRVISVEFVVEDVLT